MPSISCGSSPAPCSPSERTASPSTTATQRRRCSKAIPQYLASGGKPFVLEESHPDLRAMATGAEHDPVKFWGKLVSLASAEPPKRIQRLLNAWLPDGAAETLFYSRIAGVGSLGRPRYVGIAQCNGGLAAREAKAWLPSAWGWANGRPKDQALAVRAAQALGASARSVLCRQGRVGGAQARASLRQDRARTVPQKS